MNFAVMFDLDGTLLANEKGAFIHTYFNSLQKFAKSRIGDTPLLEKLNLATKKMVAKQDPTLTLQAFFNNFFYNSMNVDRDILIKLFDDFYQDEFPKLKKITSIIPEARQCVDEVFLLGGKVVIATNPLFPYTAVEQRLNWAGLPVKDYPFSLITTYENMHFAKPHPEYFAEILGQLGWPQGPVMMVGDDLNQDILPASVVGINSYWLSCSAQKNQESLPANVSIGDWTRLHTILSTLDIQEIFEPCNSQEHLLAILASTPAALDSIVVGLSHDELVIRPSENQWSIAEVLCHLRDVDMEVNLPRIKRFLLEENPFIAGENTDSWADLRNYNSQDSIAGLAKFTAARIEIINLLRIISKTQWMQPGRHAIFGPTSLIEIIKFITTHDQVHIQQVLATQAK